MYAKSFLLIKPFTLLIICLFVFACTNKPNRIVEPSFYYWRTVFDLSENEKQYADSLHVRELFVRFFDLDTASDVHGNIQVVPVSILRCKDSFPSNYNIVPVVYITRSALKFTTNTDSLANHINTLIESITLQYHLNFSEIQWDMDWTPSTKETYFNLLKALHQKAYLRTKKFSSTLRLHQIKYQAQTGIPPVDKVYLMCYNMGSLQQYGHQNSIFDLQLCKDYITNISNYPLPLSIALPIFHWSVLFRKQKFVGILHDISSKDIVGNSSFKQEYGNLFIAKHDTVLQNYFIKQDDELRIEEISSQDLKSCAIYLSKQLNQDSLQILFYHLDDSLIQQYPNHEIQQVLDAF